MPQKAMAGGIAGAVTVILVWALGQWGHVQVPPEVASAVTTIISTAAVFVVPHEGAGGGAGGGTGAP